MNRLRASCSYCFIFLTGATALVYEVIWQRYLTRLTGNDSLATALILGIFLGGLSGGYALCGWLSRRFNQPVQVYAWLEAIIGLWGLIFPAMFAAVASATSAWLLFYPLDNPGVLAVALSVVALSTALAGHHARKLRQQLSSD